MSRRSAAAKVLWGLSAAVLAASTLAVLAFVLLTLRERLPYWGEAEVVFEASRVRRGLPLFVDPLRGALEYGPPPSRYWVTYPPIVSYVLALVPAPVALVVGRIAATLAWFGTLAWIAVTSKRECRANAIAFAAFLGGIWLTANFAMTARPDSFACALAGVGIVRSIRDRRVDALSAGCLALAPWLKPTLLGLPVGALLADAWLRRSVRMLGVAALVVVVVGGVLGLASDGHVFEHVVRSNAQPFTLGGWASRVAHHLPFFAPVLGLAMWHGYRKRDDSGIAIGLAATVGATLWTLVALAKTGSSSNYWMEPSMAALALAAHASGPYVFGRSGLGHAAFTLGAVIYVAAASIRSSIEHVGLYRHEAALVASLRERCGAAPNEVVASDEQGIELAANGRILTTAYQMAWRVFAGKYPASLYVADVTAPNVRCFVFHSGALDAAPEVRRAIEATFAPSLTDGAFRIYRRR